MTVAELESRVATLEQRVTNLQDQLDRAQMLAGIKRGLDAADAGRMAPAREVLEKLRQKHKIACT
jgi:predicted transcriptional regulator